MSLTHMWGTLYFVLFWTHWVKFQNYYDESYVKWFQLPCLLLSSRTKERVYWPLVLRSKYWLLHLTRCWKVNFRVVHYWALRVLTEEAQSPETPWTWWKVARNIAAIHTKGSCMIARIKALAWILKYSECSRNTGGHHAIECKSLNTFTTMQNAVLHCC